MLSYLLQAEHLKYSELYRWVEILPMRKSHWCVCYHSILREKLRRRRDSFPLLTE